jgi:hypothetical protein
MNKEDIKKIIENKNFKEFIGKAENNYFDAKREPYNFENKKGKIELVKDVISFANKEGGFIIIGLKTESDSKSCLDTVKELNEIPKEKIDEDQYKGVIKDWIYPVVDFKTYFIEIKNEKGFFIIEIEKQKFENHPFLFYSEIRKGCIFGYAERRDDDTNWADIREIHENIKLGKNFQENIKFEFNDIKKEITNIKKRAEIKTTKIKKRNEKRLDQQLEVFSCKENIFSIYANPLESIVELKSLYKTNNENSIKKEFENPESLRSLGIGWDLRIAGNAVIEGGGEYIRKKDNRKIADLYKDGMFIFSCSLNELFSGKNTSFGFAELIYNFLIFYNKVLKDIESDVEKYLVCFKFKNTNGVVELFFDEDGGLFGEKPINKDIDKEIELSKKEEPEKEAYRILKEIYISQECYYDLHERYIPYTKNSNQIDIDKVKQ